MANDWTTKLANRAAGTVDGYLGHDEVIGSDVGQTTTQLAGGNARLISDGRLDLSQLPNRYDEITRSSGNLSLSTLSAWTSVPFAGMILTVAASAGDELVFGANAQVTTGAGDAIFDACTIVEGSIANRFTATGTSGTANGIVIASTTDTIGGMEVRYTVQSGDVVDGTVRVTLCYYTTATATLLANATNATSIWVENRGRRNSKPDLTWANRVYSVISSSGVITDDSAYNSFPGVIRAANGNLVCTYRVGTNHTSGNGGIACKISTNDGSTWGSASTVVQDVAYDYGTATLSLMANGDLVCTTWRRPAAGGVPPHDAIFLIVSTDNGVTWGTPMPVDVGATNLTYEAVSESNVCEGPDGAWYLGVWGANTTATTLTRSGIVKSTDRGATWAWIYDFYSATAKYNEIGIAYVENTFIVVIRSEQVPGSHYYAVSNDPTAWPPLTQFSTNSQGAPKLTVIDGAAWMVLREVTAGSDVNKSMLTAVSPSRAIRRFCAFGLATSMYGQVVKKLDGTFAAAYCVETGASNADFRWCTFAVS